MPEPEHDLDAWHLLVQQQYPRWQGLLKRAATHARLQRRIHTNVDKYHRRCLQILRDFALPVPDEEETQIEQAFFCFACDKSFLSLSAWSVHAFKVHGRVNRWRRLQERQHMQSVCPTVSIQQQTATTFAELYRMRKDSV